MAGRDHKLTRRAVLGAALAASALGRGGIDVARASGAEPAASSTPTLPSPIEGEGIEKRWRRALAALHRAEAEMGIFQERCREGALVFPDHVAQDDAYGDRLDALYAALRRLLRVPAPDWGALALKVELVVDHEVGTLTGGELCLVALRADARRLALRLG